MGKKEKKKATDKKREMGEKKGGCRNAGENLWARNFRGGTSQQRPT